MSDPKAALEEILERHQRYGLTSVCAGDHGTWAQWPCDAARVAKAMLGVVEKIEKIATWKPSNRYEAEMFGRIAREALARAAQDLEPPR